MTFITLRDFYHTTLFLSHYVIFITLRDFPHIAAGGGRPNPHIELMTIQTLIT